MLRNGRLLDNLNGALKLALRALRLPHFTEGPLAQSLEELIPLLYVFDRSEALEVPSCDGSAKVVITGAREVCR